MKMESNFDFILSFFFDIYDIEKYKTFPDLKNILKCFFQNIKLILRNSKIASTLDIPKDYLNMLNDIDDITIKLISITNGENELEENIIIFLAYYYIYYVPILFIQLISNDKNRNKIKTILNSNRNLFNNFTNDVLDKTFIIDSQNCDELECILELYPNFVEFCKIFTDDIVYKKISRHLCNEDKHINIMLIQNPKKNDNMDLLYEYFYVIIQYFNEYNFFPFIIEEDFFIAYYQLFEKDDFHKATKLMEILNLFSNNLKNIKMDEFSLIIQNYFNKGFELIKHRELINQNLIEFLKVTSLLNIIKDSTIFDELIFNIPNCIILEEKKSEFLNKILNNGDFDNFNLINFLDIYYYIVFEKVFEQFTTPKNLLELLSWDLNEKTPNEIILIFLKTIQRIWLKYPENNMYGLENLFAKEFALVSLKLDNYMEIFNDIEHKIEPKKIMVIYSQLLLEEKASDSFENHVKQYIQSYNKDLSAVYIWFLSTTEKNMEEKIIILNNFIEYEGESLAVKYTDFIEYPNFTEERITLFTNLKKYKLIDYFKNTLYYKYSINSKNDLDRIIYKDAIRMINNMNKIEVLLENFFIEKDEYTDYIIFFLNFSDSIQNAKIHYDLLKDIYNFIETFFYNEKNYELKELNEALNSFENVEIKNCSNVIKEHEKFLKYKDDAEDGKKLQQSIFFMEFYNTYKTQKKSESEIYKLSKEKFNELKILEYEGSLNLLASDIKDIIVNAAYKKPNLLDEEINFLNNYFKFNENKGYNNYYLNIIKNDINNLVKNQRNKKGDYIFNINDKFDFEIEEKEEKEEINNIIKNKDDNNFSLFSLELDIENSQSSEILNHEEKLKIKKKISSKYDSIYYLSKIIENNSNDRELENFYKLFTSFYNELFINNNEFKKLSSKDFYNEIILISDKIYLIGKNIGILDNIVKDEYKEELVLISEFKFFIEIMKRYEKISKKNFLSIFTIFHNLYNDKNNGVNIVEIMNMIEILKKNIPEQSQDNLKNSIIEIYEKEIKKSRVLKDIISFIIDQKNYFLYYDLIPIIDLVFNNELNEKFKFDNNSLGLDCFDFVSYEFNIINELCSTNEDFKEIIFYYFESNIMIRLNKIFQDNNIFFDDSDSVQAYGIKEYFNKCLEFLDNIDKNKINKYLSFLYTISFVKCFIYKIIEIYYQNLKEINGNNFFIQKNILNVNDNKEIRNALKLYIMKLIYQKCGNSFDFFNKDFSIYNIDIDDIKNKLYNEKYKDYRFDFMILPIQKAKEDIKFLNKIFLDLNNIKNGQKKIDEDINELINKCQIDELFCILVNLHFSFFIDSNYFYSKEYNNFSQWLEEQIKNDSISILKNNNFTKNIFIFFIELKNKNSITYDQLLCLIYSARFMLYILSKSNQKGFFNNIIMNSGDTIIYNIKFFEYYLKDFDIEISEKRNINCLSYKIINFCILSLLYFGYELKMIDIEDIQLSIDFDKSDIINEKNISNYLFKKIFDEFIFIKNKLIPLLGINNIIIFMDSVFSEIYQILNDFSFENKEENIFENEKIINIRINACIEQYKKNINDYYYFLKDYNKPNELIDILYEKTELYNNNGLMKDKFPFLSYLTYTNYCNFDDFKYQFFFFNDNKENYPLIKKILFQDKDNIFEIINFIPILNNFSNNVFNKFNMKISKSDINKTIKEIFKNDENDLNNFIKEYNNFIINIMKDKKYDIIREENKLGDILNIPGSKINLLYNDIIEKYNSFLLKMKIYQENKDLIEKIIIQESRENDYNINYALQDGKKVSIKEKLSEMIALYSIRLRKEKENKNLNVYDGGKIKYKYDVIESKLEELFIFGKKFFDEKQKIFIFSEDINKDMENILIELSNNFEQKITDEHFFKINDYLNKIKNDEIVLNIYYNLCLIFKYWVQNKNIFKNNNKNDEKSIDYIIRYMELKLYNLDYVKEAQKLCNYILNFNNIIIFFESVENRSFFYLTENIRKKIINEKINIDENIKNKIEQILNNNKILKKDILLKYIKKYIIRYLKNNDDFIFNFKDIYKKNIFDKKILNNNKFEEEFDILCSINSKDNAIVKYCICCIYNILNEKDEIFQEKIKGNEEDDLFDAL